MPAMAYKKNMDMNGCSYGSENEYEYDSQYDSEYFDEEEYFAELEKQQKEKEEKEKREKEEKKKIELEQLQSGLGVVKSFLNWGNIPVQTGKVQSLLPIAGEQEQEKGWCVKEKKERKKEIKDEVEKKEICKQQKTEMCRSIGKYICRHSSCRYAHSIKELNVVDCDYGSNCKSVRFNRNSSKYINNIRSSKDKICTRKHPSETKSNFFIRTGIKDPVTEEEMISDFNFTQEFFADKKNSIELETKGVKEIYNPVTGNVIFVSTEKDYKKKKEDKKTKEEDKKKRDEEKKIKEENKKKMEEEKNKKIEREKKIKNVKTKIFSLEARIAENNISVKKNNGLISRFAERVEVKVCQDKVAELKRQNEVLNQDNVNILEEIKTLKDSLIVKEVVTVETKVLEQKVPTPVIEPIKTQVFNLTVKSFRNAVSSEPSIPSTPQSVKSEIRKEEGCVLKTELCRSVGKYTCTLGDKCRFAHSKKELKIVECRFGGRCFDVECVDGTYINKENIKNRICQRQHQGENIENVYKRLGFQVEVKPNIVSEISSEEGWKEIKVKKIQQNVTSQNMLKTQLCKSFCKYECRLGSRCNFAHNLKELKIIECPFGDRCYDAECINGTYVNIKNVKNRTCQRQHPGESIKNVHDRIKNL